MAWGAELHNGADCRSVRVEGWQNIRITRLVVCDNVIRVDCCRVVNPDPDELPGPVRAVWLHLHHRLCLQRDRTIRRRIGNFDPEHNGYS